MIRKPYGFRNATPRELRRPLFPVPEDIFASDDQVAERHEQDVRSPAIDRAIDDWNAAKEQGDESGLHAAAKSIVDATSAAFKLQGVPTFAHPVLPPQFVKAEISELIHLPDGRRRSLVDAIANRFDPSAKLGATQQLATAASSSQLGDLNVANRWLEDAPQAPFGSSPQARSLPKAIGVPQAVEDHGDAPEDTTQDDMLRTTEYSASEDPAQERTGEHRPDRHQPSWQQVLRRDDNKNIKFDEFERGTLKDPETGRTYPVTYGIVYTDRRRTPIPARRNDSGDGRLTTNCHGFVFADGRYWIEPGFAGLILRDDYVKLPTSNMMQKDDIVIYRDGQGRPVHSARVTKVLRDASGRITGMRVIGKRGSLEDAPFESSIEEQWPPKGRSGNGITRQFYRRW
jgi:hypothetical protein